jgi:hypothetical protein
MQVTHINENSVVDLHFQECLEQLKWGPQVQHSFKQFATVANGYCNCMHIDNDCAISRR